MGFFNDSNPMLRARPDKGQWLGGPESLERLKGADIIIALDKSTGQQQVMYGHSTLKGVVASNASVVGNVVYVEILMNTDELNVLAGAIIAAKGYYNRPDQTIPLN